MLRDGRRCDVGTGGELDGEEVRGGSGDAECAEGLRYLIAGISKPASNFVERERERERGHLKCGRMESTHVIIRP